MPAVTGNDMGNETPCRRSVTGAPACTVRLRGSPTPQLLSKVVDLIEKVPMEDRSSGPLRPFQESRYDQPAWALDRRTGAAPLIICGRHNGIDTPSRYLFDRARWNSVRIEVLTLVRGRPSHIIWVCEVGSQQHTVCLPCNAYRHRSM
jgi:hypothetical protein